MVAASGRRRASTSDRARTGTKPMMSRGRPPTRPAGKPFFRAVMLATAMGEVGSLAISSSMTDHAHEGHKNQCGYRCPPASRDASRGQESKGQHEGSQDGEAVEAHAAVEI